MIQEITPAVCQQIVRNAAFERAFYGEGVDSIDAPEFCVAGSTVRCEPKGFDANPNTSLCKRTAD